MNFLEYFKDIISPKKCYSCKKEGSFLCLDCMSKMSNYNSFCYLCKRKTSKFNVHKECLRKNIYYDKIIVLTHYKNYTISKLIKDGKYYNRKDIFEDLGIYLSYLLFENLEGKNEDYIIIDSPIYFLKKLFRGFNQSEILAKIISKKIGIKYISGIIIKNKKTIQQSKLTKFQRLSNLDNAFKVNKKYLNDLRGKKVIVVDDIISTGSTINEIGKVLKKYGVSEVIGLVIASD